jgi:6-phosphogluconolactonase (cycloisomerase 2 family)
MVPHTGRWLVAAGMDANEVEVFAVDPATGDLTGNGEKLGGITKPACVRF